MATKRSHATYASDTLPPSYATYGTPLPPSPSSRDDGTYLPLWKQEVRDERGRKRLHGAFTGGFSAGYFNTVGSKEGWTPSTFVSSRGDRRKDDGKEKGKGLRPEDFMDEEDLADQAESQKLKTSGAFAGLGQGGTDEGSRSGLMGLFRAEGDTMGTKLLRRMGWKDGQGIGPKIRRGARLDVKANGEEQTYLFAPDNATMINFTRKTDRKGLGHAGEAKLSSATAAKDEDNDDEDDAPSERSKFSLASSKKKQPQKRSGIGVGILNDDGSDEEDPYAVGPKITYNRVLGGDKKKKKKKPKEAVAVNPSLGNAPVFLSKSARGLRKCHDGRLPLDGFVLAKVTEDFSNLLSEYAPPSVPEGWTSPTQNMASSDSPYVSTADAAKASTHDPKSRASLLGEAALPGKSVFDYLSPSVRDALAAASGKSNLPQGRGEVPEEYRLTPDEKHAKLWNDSPKVDKETAVAALGRTNGGPYSDNEAKRERYRYYLSSCAYPDSYPAPEKKKGETNDDFVREMTEFHACAGIFKPLTGAAASRFTSATTILGGEPQTGGLSKKSEPVKPSDPAMEAAKMGMYGKMTRSIDTWYPTRLLCKRFNVKVPEHVQVDGDAEPEKTQTTETSKFASASESGAGIGVKEMTALPPAPTQEKVNPEKNEAVEAGAAHAEVLKAIFGDSDSE